MTTTRALRFALLVLILALAAAPAALSRTNVEEANGKVTMPNVVGMRMDKATRLLHQRNLRVNEECHGAFGCWVKSNWVICTQSPRPGRMLTPYTVVMIYGERAGNC